MISVAGSGHHQKLEFTENTTAQRCGSVGSHFLRMHQRRSFFGPERGTLYSVFACVGVIEM